MPRPDFFSLQFLQSLLRLTRTGNLIIIALAQYFTAAFITYTSIMDVRLFILSLSTVLIAAGGYVINDYYDVKIDFVNKPDRVVIGKSITRRYALLFHSALSIAGVALGLYLSLPIALVNLFSAFLLWFYSNQLKRLPFVGNFSVALLTALSVMVVELLYPGRYTLVLIYALFAFFMTLVREIVKDMEDLRGDHTFGCKTLPIVLGIRRSKIVLYTILLLFVITVFMIDNSYGHLPEYFFLFLLATLAFFAYRLAEADTVREYRMLSSFCKIILLLGIISMAFLP
jgi:4-hydroxybenzoate polyprenyltransferase